MSLESSLPTVNTQYVVTYLENPAHFNTVVSERSISANKFFDDLESAHEFYLLIVNDWHCVQMSKFELMTHNEIMESV